MIERRNHLKAAGFTAVYPRHGRERSRFVYRVEYSVTVRMKELTVFVIGHALNLSANLFGERPDFSRSSSASGMISLPG